MEDLVVCSSFYRSADDQETQRLNDQAVRARPYIKQQNIVLNLLRDSLISSISTGGTASELNFLAGKLAMINEVLGYTKYNK